MSNNMCGIANAPVTAQTPTTKNAAAMQYANSIKRMANNDTVAIREMVKWFITATESFNIPQMHDKLSRFAVQHEKQVGSILRDLDRYVEMDNNSPQKAILANFMQRLTDNKKEAMDAIMNEVVYGLVSSDIITLCQQMSNEMTIEAYHQQTRYWKPSFHSRQSLKRECCCGKDVSSSQMSKSARSDLQTAYAMANKDIGHLLWLLSGLVITTITHQSNDSSLLKLARKISTDVYQSLEDAKETYAKRQLSPKEQIALIGEDLKELLAYIEVCQSSPLNGNQEEGQPTSK